jgi:hypothetical protein
MRAAAVEQIALNSEAENNPNREEINTKLMNRPETGPHHVAKKPLSSSNLSRESPVRKTVPCSGGFTTLSVSRLYGVEWLDGTLIRNDLE